MPLAGNKPDVECGRRIARRGALTSVPGADCDRFVDAIERMEGVKA